MSDQTPRYSTTLSPGAFELVRHVVVVLFTAALAATVFTVWTPASILPPSAASGLAAALATQQQVGPNSTPIPPTLTPRVWCGRKMMPQPELWPNITPTEVTITVPAVCLNQRGLSLISR